MSRASLANGYRLLLIGVLTIGIPVAVWQRGEISRTGDLGGARAEAQTELSRAELERRLDRVYRRAAGGEFRYGVAHLAASRLLRDRSDRELEEMFQALRAKFGGAKYDLALAILRERAKRDVRAALDIGLAVDRQYANELIGGFAIRDPDGAEAWLEGVRARYGGKEFSSLAYALERMRVVALRQSDPLAALEQVFGEEGGHLAAAEWDMFVDRIGEEHWAPFAAFAVAGTDGIGRHDKGRRVLRVVAESMLAKTGFERAWESIGKLGLDREAEDVFAEVLVCTQPGSATPAKVQRLFRRLPEERHPIVLREVAADWADIDQAACREWLLGLPEGLVRSMLSHTSARSVGLREGDLD